MAGKYARKKLKDISLSDPFFDSLKKDYPEFANWYNGKALQGDEAYTFEDEFGLCAFLYFKDYESEEIKLTDRIIPPCGRIKIRTLKLDFRHHGRRLGEGAIGIALWKWQESPAEQIYLTVYESHTDLINLLTRYGFKCLGTLHKNSADTLAQKEMVFMKDKKDIDFSTPLTAFPFLKGDFSYAGMLPVNDVYHDRMFPYSELKNTQQEFWDEAAGNGISKVYVGAPQNVNAFYCGEPVFIYRKYTGAGSKTYKSCVTSFATISGIKVIKDSRKELLSFEEFKNACGNKTIFTESELQSFYRYHDNVVVIEFVYNGFFGKGNNVNHKELNDNGLFNTYPYNIHYSRRSFERILNMGGKNVQNIIVN